MLYIILNQHTNSDLMFGIGKKLIPNFNLATDTFLHSDNDKFIKPLVESIVEYAALDDLAIDKQKYKDAAKHVIIFHKIDENIEESLDEFLDTNQKITIHLLEVKEKFIGWYLKTT